MPVLSDKWIKKTVKTMGMIRPFVGKQVRKGRISFLKTLGSTMPEFTFVNILNSFETLASYP